MKAIPYILMLLIFINVSFINRDKKKHVNAKRERKECLKQFEQDVKKGWHYNAQIGLYTLDTPFAKKLNQRYPYKCLKGMDTSYVYKIMGEQHKQFDKYFSGGHVDSMWFAIKYPIMQNGWDEYSIEVIFTKKGKVTRIYLDRWQSLKQQ